MTDSRSGEREKCVGEWEFLSLEPKKSQTLESLRSFTLVFDVREKSGSESLRLYRNQFRSVSRSGLIPPSLCLTWRTLSSLFQFNVYSHVCLNSP